MSDQSLPDIPVPSGWAKNVKSAVLHVISLAHYTIVAARGWAANSLNARARLSGENGQIKQEVQLLCEELRIKNARWMCAPARDCGQEECRIKGLTGPSARQ